jgi:4-hydroxythreonine-4-phosphate dehydrogenase
VAAEAVVAAVVLCQQGAIDAVATAPISKKALNAAGYRYPGHTELLADLTGAKSWAMMFAADRLKVTLATIHQPVRTVASSLSTATVLDKILLTDRALRLWWRVPKPRIAVLGLNPHAGESGLLGAEEGSVIRPAVARARKLGIDAAGPVSAEDGFRQAMEGRADALVAMYHDQGLLPLKVLGGATNVTLGLSMVRTSPDHGTALDIAGRGRADPGPMTRAVLLAARLAVQ